MTELAEVVARALRNLPFASLEAALLVLLLLGLRRALGLRWRASYWLPLLLVMSLPWLPRPGRGIPLPRSPESHQAVASAQAQVSDPAAKAFPPEPAVSAFQRWMPEPPTLLAGVWALGACLVLGSVLHGNLRLWRRIRQGRPLTSQPELEVLEEAKASMGLRTLVAVVVSEAVPGPALFGWIRPRIVLPGGLLTQLSPEDLRHVFLHELAHLRRMDIPLAWLMALLQAVHWFNPLVWLAFARVREDREVACDTLALESRAATQPSAQPEAYGHTLLRLVEAVPAMPTLAALAGVSESSTHLKRRITVISRFTPNSRRSRWLSPLILGALGLGALAFHLEAQSVAPANRIVDKVDYPFVDDPALVGGWRAVDFVKRPEDFNPTKPQWKHDLFLKEIFVRPGGTTNWAWTWTKGLFLHHGDQTASRYEIKEISGKRYLFFEWKSGDYTFRHQKPSFYVLVRDDRAVDVQSRTRDKVDYPFVDDPEVLGVWKAVDFVEKPEDFKPGKPQGQDDLYFKQVEFLPGGQIGKPWVCTWTRGLVLSARDETASRYQIQQIEGKPYLFLEWKSGDYTLRGRKPQYYVMTR